jgi:hypothetical protein
MNCATCNLCKNLEFFEEQLFPRIQVWGEGQEPVLLIDDSSQQYSLSLSVSEGVFWMKELEDTADKDFDAKLRVFERHTRLVGSSHSAPLDINRYLEYLSGGHANKIAYTNALRCSWDVSMSVPDDAIYFCKPYTQDLIENRLAIITGLMGAKQLGIESQYAPGRMVKDNKYGYGIVLFIPALTEIHSKREESTYIPLFERLFKNLGLIK